VVRSSFPNDGRVNEIGWYARFSNEPGELSAANLFYLVVIEEELKHPYNLRQFDDENRGNLCAELIRQGRRIYERLGGCV
jgi:hypothetical protein